MAVPTAPSSLVLHTPVGRPPRLEWALNSASDNVDFYSLYRDGVHLRDTRGFSLVDLSAGTSVHTWHVTATNADGESAASNSVTGQRVNG